MVGPVKTQGMCGSAAVYSTVAAVESFAAIVNGKFVGFSEQQLVDCVSGCR